MKQCELCEKPLGRDNLYGFCKRNPECVRSGARERQRKYREINREVELETQRRYRESGRHNDLTYLRYSPGLGIYKIGHTTNLARNHRELKRGCPDIELVETWPYGIELERWLHRYFKDVRIPSTEWFKVTEAEVRAAVTEYEQQLQEAA